MKKIILSSLFIAGIAVAFTGCLKDKGFDNNEYGIYNPESQPPGVGFPLSNKAQSIGVDITPSNQTLTGLINVNLQSDKAAPASVKITLADNTAALVAAYNTENGLTGSSAVLPLASGLYNFANSLEISAGGRFAEIPLNVTNTTSLSLTRSYAVGITISSVDGGYTIASNMKNLLVIMSLKNRLDGVYEITGEALRAGDPLLTGAFGPYQRTLATSGANSVQWEGTVRWANTGNSSLPAGFEPNITVDPATNLVTSVSSTSGIYMTAPIIRTDIIGTVQRYDPATKTLYFEFSYGGGPTSRLFSIKAKYIKPR
jgi:Domain of unknown function (DUF1735)